MKKNTGLNVNYYLVTYEPKRAPGTKVTAECEDIIMALGMSFEQGCAFKAIWRACAAQHLGVMKASYDGVLYDAEKQVHYSALNLTLQRRKHEMEQSASTGNGYDHSSDSLIKTSGFAQTVPEKSAAGTSPLVQPGALSVDNSPSLSPHLATQDRAPAGLTMGEMSVAPLTEEQVDRHADELIKASRISPAEILLADHYQKEACRTAPPGETLLQALMHCSLGFSTEAGEYTTEVKRAMIYGNPLSDKMKKHMLEEIGDLLWYAAYACAQLDAPLSKVMSNNIEKLRIRFPDKFTQFHAEARLDKGGLDARNS